MRLSLFLFALTLAAQDPNTLDQARAQIARITANPVTDPINLPRIALRAPLLADPSVSLAELQSAQNSLLRLSRMAAPVLATPPPDFQPVHILYQPQPRLTTHKATGKPTTQSSAGPLNSPGGGVDGRITGAYGVSTQLEQNPWWQVDLGTLTPITAIRLHPNLVYPERAHGVRILLSADGLNWAPHSGQPARFLRLERTGPAVLQFDELEVR
jgi:hypothetical protein